jgi:hypothetical protein
MGETLLCFVKMKQKRRSYGYIRIKKVTMSLPTIRVTRGLLFSVLTFFFAACLSAAETGSQTVQVKIGTILASNQTDGFDSRLAPLEKQLKLMKYRSYRLLKEETQNVRQHTSATFVIPGGRSLIITPQDYQNNRIDLKVHMQRGDKPLLDTTVKLPNRGNFLSGGFSHEGGVLVLSISATVQ